MSPVTLLPTVDVAYLDARLLDADGRLRVLPSAAYDGIPHAHLQLWCHQHAVYGLPTIELIAWLRARIGDRTAIEIGAGNGALGRTLGIP